MRVEMSLLNSSGAIQPHLLDATQSGDSIRIARCTNMSLVTLNLGFPIPQWHGVVYLSMSRHVHNLVPRSCKPQLDHASLAHVLGVFFADYVDLSQRILHVSLTP